MKARYLDTMPPLRLFKDATMSREQLTFRVPSQSLPEKAESLMFRVVTRQIRQAHKRNCMQAAKTGTVCCPAHVQDLALAVKAQEPDPKDL